MQFQPKTEAELAAMMLQHNGVYDFDVTEAEEGVSAKNNEMIVLKLVVFSPDGNEHKVKDWLVASDHPLSLSKLQNFCKTTGVPDKYTDGTLTAYDCQGLVGKVRIAINDDPKYGRQSKVGDYVPLPSTTPPLGIPAPQAKAANKAQAERDAAAAAAGFPDPEIPF